MTNARALLRHAYAQALIEALRVFVVMGCAAALALAGVVFRF